MAFFLVSSSLFESCKKREQPRFRFWPFKVMFIMGNSEKAYFHILDHIDKARTTINVYDWDGDTIVLNGPAGYTPLKIKSSEEWKMAVNNDLMPDTTQLGQLGEIIRGLKEFLDERRDHSASKAWDRIRLAIPRKLYKSYPHFFERLLTAFKDYYTGPVGGSSDFNSGLRDLQSEIDICNLISAPDPDDGWGYNCSALLHYESIFLSYAEGDTKMMDVSLSIDEVQTAEANVRYKAAVAKYGYAIGTVEDYKTRYSEEGEEAGSEDGYYYLELDLTR